MTNSEEPIRGPTPSEAEEPYSTLEVDDRIQPIELQSFGKEALPGDKKPVQDEQPHSRPFSTLEAYDPNYSTIQEPAAIEAYHPSWSKEHDGIIAVDAEQNTYNGPSEKGVETTPPNKVDGKRICGLRRHTFWLSLALALLVVAFTIIGAVVGTLVHQQAINDSASSASMTSSSSSATPISTMASSTTTGASASASATVTYGANITNCNQNKFNWYNGAQDGTCNQANVKEGFEVIALTGDCTGMFCSGEETKGDVDLIVSHYTDYYCSDNATASTLYHCYDLIKSFTVDNCN